MQQYLEFIPLALFFLTYKMSGETLSLASWEYTLDGIYSATLVLIIATTIQVLVSWILSGKLEKRLLWTWLAVVIFGGLTVILRDKDFIMWKPTIFNWALALAFIGSHWVGEKNLLERTLGGQLALPKHLWARLSYLWIANFTLVGGLNIWVAKHYSEDIWVSYKLYSSIGFTLAMTLITVLIIAPHLKDNDANSEEVI